MTRQRVDEERPVPPPPPEPEFRQLFADVTPLRDDGRYHAPPARPSPRPRNKKADGGYSAALEQELMRQLVGWFEPAECDRQFVRGGVNATTLKRLRNGHLGGVAPYGFKVVGEKRESKLEPVEAEQPILREILALAKDEHTSWHITNMFRDKGYKNRVGKPFECYQIARIIDRAQYANNG